MNAKIEIKETPELNLAGVTHVGINGIKTLLENSQNGQSPKVCLII